MEHVNNEMTRVEENESHQEGGDREATTQVLGCQAFAMFSLYLLHETNPLPSAPASYGRMVEKHMDTSQLLSTLPMGLTNHQNPRLEENKRENDKRERERDEIRERDDEMHER